MIAPPDLVLAGTALVGAAALSVAEAAAGARLPRAVVFQTWLRHTLTRATALSVLGFAVRRLLAATGPLVWHDLDGFLLRHATPPPAAPWGTLLALVVLGLALVALTLPPPPVAALGWFLAGAAVSGWLVAVRLFPLQAGRPPQLLLVALGVAVPAAGTALAATRAALRRRPEPEEAAALGGLLRAGLRGLAGLGLLGVVLTHDLWAGAPVPFALGLLTAGLAAAAVLRRGLAALRHQGGRGPAPAMVAEALLSYRRVAWLTFLLLFLAAHAGVLTAVAPAHARQARGALDDVARWPQLLTGQPDPSDAQWEAAARRIRTTLHRYDRHPWCGEWLLILAWIEATRLHHPHRARLLLLEARDHYPRARAAAPPGWRHGRTVGAIADRMLGELGRIVEPGAHPA